METTSEFSSSQPPPQAKKRPVADPPSPVLITLAEALTYFGPNETRARDRLRKGINSEEIKCERVDNRDMYFRDDVQRCAESYPADPAPLDAPDKWIKGKEAAQLLNTTLTHVLQIAGAGYIAVRREDGRVLYSRADVVAYLPRRRHYTPRAVGAQKRHEEAMGVARRAQDRAKKAEQKAQKMRQKAQKMEQKAAKVAKVAKVVHVQECATETPSHSLMTYREAVKYLGSEHVLRGALRRKRIQPRFVGMTRMYAQEDLDAYNRIYRKQPAAPQPAAPQPAAPQSWWPEMTPEEVTRWWATLTPKDVVQIVCEHKAVARAAEGKRDLYESVVERSMRVQELTEQVRGLTEECAMLKRISKQQSNWAANRQLKQVNDTLVAENAKLVRDAQDNDRLTAEIVRLKKENERLQQENRDLRVRNAALSVASQELDYYKLTLGESLCEEIDAKRMELRTGDTESDNAAPEPSPAPATPVEPVKGSEIKLTSLGLSIRSQTALREALGENATVADVCKLGQKGLMQIRGIGRRSHAEIISMLSAEGCAVQR